MSWQLVMRESGRHLLLERGCRTLGSDERCDLRIDQPTVSRRHARFRIEENALVIEDLDSSNGTRVNGRLISGETGLSAGDRLSFGMVEADVEQLAPADSEPALRLGDTRPVPDGNNRKRSDPTLVAEGATRFVIADFRDLIAYARRTRDTRRLAARMMAALTGAFEVLDFSIETTRGEVLAGRRREAEARVETVSAGEYAIRINGPAPARRNARPGVELCAGLLDLVAGTGPDTGPSPRAGAPSPPTERPEPTTVNRTMIGIYDRAERVAPSRLSILIQGETGTGKELLSRFVHTASGRAGEFVAVNCAALPRDLLETQLFGIEAGVATGVDARPGRFVQADGGTLLLDEITEMPDDCQAKLLRVLQEGEVVPVGAQRPIKVDVRILAATNRRISSRSDGSGPLRPDLVHRLSGWPVTLPPLRDRSEDIPQLAAYFLAAGAGQAGRAPAGISRSALDALMAHDWPGNVRQLEQEMHRAALFAEDGELLTPRHLSPEIATAIPQPESLDLVSAEAERKAIEAALAGQDGNATRAAETLGISRATLYRRMKDLDIRRRP